MQDDEAIRIVDYDDESAALPSPGASPASSVSDGNSLSPPKEGYNPYRDNHILPVKTTIACFVIAILIGYPATLAFMDVNYNDWSQVSTQDYLNCVFTFAPLVGLQLLLGYPPAAFRVKIFLNSIKLRGYAAVMPPNSSSIKDRTFFILNMILPASPVALLCITCWVIGNGINGYFDPNATMYFVMSSFGALLIHRLLKERTVESLSSADVMLWLWFWVSIDYRSFEAYWNVRISFVLKKDGRESCVY